MWLLDASPFTRSNLPNGPPTCDPVYDKLRGYDTLKSSTDVSVGDLVASTFDAWELKQKNHDWKLDASYAGSGDTLPLMGGARTPGFFAVPACTYDVLIKNFGPDPKCANYPCCP
jgi:hypothetical protein